MTLLNGLSVTTALTPHGFDLLRQPGDLWLGAISDGITMLAYYSIPLALLWFVHRCRDLPHKWITGLFTAFVVACGTAHGLAILTLWMPAYHLDTAMKVLTAGLSIAIAAVLWQTMPKLLALPSADSVAALNAVLQNTVLEQQHTTAELNAIRQQLMLAQQTLRRSNEELEARVAERTAELVRLNQTVGRSEARFRKMVESAPSAVVMINETGTIEMVNAQTERLFGYARSELIGRTMEVLLPARFRARHPELRANFFAAPQSRAMGAGTVLFAMRKDGTEFEVEIGLNPIETDEGLMVLSAIVDISHRVRMEAELRQSQKMDAIGRVAAGVAHDFNNLLLALSGSLEMLLDVVADRPAAVEWGAIALRATQRGGELTHRLLSFSRRQILQAVPVSIDKLFTELAQLINHLFESNTRAATELVVMPVSPELAAMADPAQLEAALINLAVNARDALERGGCLRISAYAAEADLAIVSPGRYTVISVADTGCGMGPDTLAQACEPFFTTKGLEGTGLGLSMVQGFARQSGGEIHISSVPDEGTTIDLWLPSAEPHVPIETPVMPHTPMTGRVLVVDDSPDALLVVGAFLRHAGLDVTSVANGALALAELADGRRFDVLVTDFVMPGMNGLDLLMQAHVIDPAMVGMIITGFFQSDLPSELDEVAVLRKPFNRAELVETVRNLIGLRGRGLAVTEESGGHHR